MVNVFLEKNKNSVPIRDRNVIIKKRISQRTPNKKKSTSYWIFGTMRTKEKKNALQYTCKSFAIRRYKCRNRWNIPHVLISSGETENKIQTTVFFLLVLLLTVNGISFSVLDRAIPFIELANYESCGFEFNNFWWKLE